MALTLPLITITTTPYTIVQANTSILVNVSGPASIILPTGSGADSGKSYYIKDKSGLALKNPITIIAAGGKLIDGIFFAMLNSGYSHIQVISDGTNWYSIA